MLYGDNLHNIDSKRRITLPAQYRSHFADGVFINNGWDGCLVLYTKADSQLEQEKVADLDDNIPANRDYKRLYYSCASMEMLDSQGRIQLSQDQIEHAKLGKEVRIIGVGNRLEIWNKEAWQEYKPRLESDREKLAEETTRTK